MKKILVVLLVLVLGIGGGIGMFLLSQYLSKEEIKEKESGMISVNVKEPDTYKPPENDQNISKYIFVGDSRYVGMEHLATENDVFICEDGEGCDFLIAHLDEIRSNVADQDSAIIIGLGVNDFRYNIELYIETMNALAEEELCNLCYMLVNPVDENVIQYSRYQITNEELDDFNRQMTERLDSRITIIDTNSFLKNYGYVTEDGLHYDNETYESIYWYIKENLTKN